MTKRDIIVNVASRLGVTQGLAKEIFEESLSEITGALSKGKRTEIRNFGVFYTKERKGRIGRNPRTGEKVPIPSRKVAVFKPGKLMKQGLKK